MRFEILGPMRAGDGDAVRPVRGFRQRVVLAALLAYANQPVPVERLADLAWDGAPPAGAAATLRTYVMRLRQGLGAEGGSRIVTRDLGYLVQAGESEVDASQFEALGRDAGSAAGTRDWRRAAAVAGQALALWHGPPLADVPCEAVRELWVPRLERLRVHILECRAEAGLHLRQPGQLATELHELTAQYPLHERFHCFLMAALALGGRQAEALAVYQDARRMLVGELGIEPGPEMRQVHEQILAGNLGPYHEAAAGPAVRLPGSGEHEGISVPGPASPARPDAGQGPVLGVAYSLPPDTAGFTGRQAELDRITAAVAEAGGSGGAEGVVAICAIGGMPGVGKTALAVHAAHQLKEQFPDRQLFLGLHGHTPGQDPVTPHAALGVLLAAAGADARYLPEDLPGRTALWRDKMAGQRALIVLDNAASTAQVVPLLPGSGGCLVLVTSRRHLGDLPSVTAPVQLPVLSPREAKEMFTRLAPRAADGPEREIAALTELAGFLPLAVGLLARVYARHPAWTLADLAAETRAGMLTLTAEHDSVAAAFALSYRHLAPGLQQLFRRLALHPGTSTDACAAAALSSVSLAEAAGLLDGLHGEGLLTETGHRRYGMHDLIRAYARDLAATDPPATRQQALDRLLDYYQHTAALADSLLARKARTRPAPAIQAIPAAFPDLADRARALAWARAERGTLLACLDQATEAGQHTRVIALTAAMEALLRHDGPWTTAVTRHAAAAQAADRIGDRLAQANAHNDLGNARVLTGDHQGAAQALEQALAISRDIGDRPGQAYALELLGRVRMSTGDYPGSVQALEQALAISRDIGDRPGQAYALEYLGRVRHVSGDYPGAAQVLELALEISRDIGHRAGQADTLDTLGRVRTATGDYREAAQVLEQALEISRDIGNRLGQANALDTLGRVRTATGDYREAAQVLEQALAIYRDIGNRLGQVAALISLGITRRMTGDYQDAAQVLEQALAISRDIGDQGAEAEILNETGALHHAHGDPGRATEHYRQALTLSRALISPWDEAYALAGLGRCALADGRTSDAVENLGQARDIFRKIGAAEVTGITAELDSLTTPAQGPPALEQTDPAGRAAAD